MERVFQISFEGIEYYTIRYTGGAFLRGSIITVAETIAYIFDGGYNIGKFHLKSALWSSKI